MSTFEWNNRNILLALHETEGIGWKSIHKITLRSDLTECIHFGDREWAEIGFNPGQRKKIAGALRTETIVPILERYERLGVRIITMLDEDYPPLLKVTYEPPWVLYAIGRTDLLITPTIAMVGTRVPTSYGRASAIKLAEQLSGSGLTIVSGMAKGIDRYAHEGALSCGGDTIAVLGTSVERIYPPENRALYQSIADKGLIISEYPFGTTSHPGLFPRRNRIIAGIALGTVVVEAAEKSGSLITADQALEMSREVYAVPGPISSPKSEATNRLIAEGAKLVRHANDILVDFIHRGDIRSGLPAGKIAKKPASALSDEERLILQLLQDKPSSADELHERSGLAFGHLHAILINLSIKRLIEQHPGFIYSVL
ncbi:DNA-processing protein DprA [Paenibacillus tarimensis]